MPVWVDAINFVGDQVLGATAKVGNAVGDGILEIIGVDTKALAESSKSPPKYEKQQSTSTHIDIHIECPLELLECERCGECGKEIEDWEDVEDFEQ